MYDPPDHLSNIRNNMKKHGCVVDNRTVSWTPIAESFEKDSRNAICIAPRLSKRHIDLPEFAPLRVCLAAQVLSHSVGTGMTAMVDIVDCQVRYHVCF